MHTQRHLICHYVRGIIHVILWFFQPIVGHKDIFMALKLGIHHHFTVGVVCLSVSIPDSDQSDGSSGFDPREYLDQRTLGDLLCGVTKKWLGGKWLFLATWFSLVALGISVIGERDSS